MQEGNSKFVQKHSANNTTISINVSKFKQRLRGIMEWLLNPHAVKVGQLNQNVLTAFDWHANLDEDTA